MIIDQLTCIENPSCIWQQNSCQNFQNCPTAQTKQQCLSSSLNCPFFNQNTKQCYALTANICSNFSTASSCQSQLGYCQWSGNQCSQIQSCGYLGSQVQCSRFAYSCVWTQGRCQSLTCSSIQNSNNCMYTIPNLYTKDVQPCVWRSGKCQNLTDSNSLNATQCLSNTLHTYKWTGSICISCSQNFNLLQISLQLPSQCSCSQLSNEDDCIQTTTCVFSNQVCQPLQCSNIQTQFSCATNPNCVWFRGECQNFKFCADLIGASQSECIFQSVNCPASNGLFCREKNYLQPCQTYQFQSSCTDALGNNGFCLWQNGSCQVLSKCQQLLQQKDCLNFQKQCYWSNNICQPLSCSIFTNPQNCQYYYSSINSYTPISCYWNSYQSLCAQTTDFMTQLNSATCSANTRQTARWSNTLSICLKCGAPPLPNPYKCACSFLISQINCMQSQECIWNTQTNQCEQQSCINLKQSLCIQNSQCMWVGFCAAFKSCNVLYAVNSEECAAQSLRCPYFNSEKGQCEAISSYINCGYVDNQNQCDQYYSINFRCEWNYQQNKCQIYISCQQYYNPYICNTQPQCYWYNYGCQIKTCQNYNTLESCTFVFNPNIWNYIQSCSWLNGACVAANNLFSEQTCFINTDQTARWSSNNQDGYCIPCSISLSQLVVPKNKCLCSQILTEYECNQANCYWDQGYCSEEFCPESQVQCAQNPKCYWIYQRENYTYGYCRQIPVIKIQEFCTTLRGNNSLECLSQTIQCPVSLDGVCQSKEHLQTCQSMKSLQLCSNGIGQEGYCKYENQSCQVLSSCKQLKSFTECNIFNKACYWDMSTGLCEQMTCESQSQATCTYVFQSINQANIQQCYWNGRSCSSELYVISSYSFQTCFQNTGGTYHWSNSKSNYGSCVSCSLNRIKPKHTCSCTVLNEKECTLAKPVCKFNQNKQCVKSACQEIFNSVTCSEQIECMWQSNQCVDFTSCTDLYGSSSLDCIAQSLQCQVVSNHICKSVQSLNTCSQYSMEFCKIDIIGSDGLCYWNSTNKVCQVISSCDKVTNQSICQYLNRTCQWSYFFQSCVPFQCQDYPYEELCTNVIVNLQDPQIMLCVWKNQKCIPYEDTYYRFDDSICYANSDHTYRWVKEDKYGVRCQQCLSTFLTNVILAFTILYIL